MSEALPKNDCRVPPEQRLDRRQAQRHRVFDLQIRIGSATENDRPVRIIPTMSASLIGRFGSSAFRLSTAQCRCRSRARASLRNRHQGPSIMGFENEAEQSIGRPCRRLTAGPSGHTISPHPSSREGHHSTARWSSRFSYRFDLVWLSCCYGFFPAPAELGAVNPDAVHDHGQPARQRHDCLFHAAAPGDLHRPGLEPGPLR